MIEAKADVICAHFGFTTGGMMGAKKSFSIEHAKIVADKIFSACENADYDPIKLVYGGPAGTPIDMQYLYDNTACTGYIGGSAIERIPAERAIMETTGAFKSTGGFSQNEYLMKVLDRNRNSYDCVRFVKKYIHEQYSDDIRLRDLALLSHVSYSYLSTLFKKEVGCSFSEYLVKYRINKAAEIMCTEKLPLVSVAMMVGYNDYPQFSKMFKKYKGMSPRAYRSANINTTL
jgi:AraC-like DNA-binding protein